MENPPRTSDPGRTRHRIRLNAAMPRRRKVPVWTPKVGALAHYASPYSGLTRAGCPVRVLAEASGQRMCVEIIGHAGRPVQITVKTRNLSPMPPSLFDGLDVAL
jgi:hypothetical protein